MTGSWDSPPPPRSPWQRFYGAVLARRRRSWSARAARLQRPVLSVGNLLWGGGGKTPVVAALCELLRDSGRRVGVLSRGYGSRGRGPRVVSLGGGPRLGPDEAGDEPYLLAERLSGVAIAVCGDRVAASEALLAETSIDCFVLDDAFSHVRLARDLDLLVFPASEPFGGGRLLPSGRLREPLTASRFADAALLTGLDEPDPDAAGALARALAPHGFEGEAFASALDLSLREPEGEARPDRFVLVSGTARPEAVRRSAGRLGLELVDHRVFPDHHPYPDRSLAAIRRACADSEAPVLTTAKDRVKLERRLGLPLWEIEVAARPEPRFGVWVEERIQALERLRNGG